MKKALKAMDYNEHKYWAESSDLIEAEKIQMAKDLRELERRGVIEFRDGRWGLVAGADSEETPEGEPADADVAVTQRLTDNINKPEETL
jgi:hypothetical protein